MFKRFLHKKKLARVDFFTTILFIKNVILVSQVYKIFMLLLQGLLLVF